MQLGDWGVARLGRVCYGWVYWIGVMWCLCLRCCLVGSGVVRLARV